MDQIGHDMVSRKQGFDKNGLDKHALDKHALVKMVLTWLINHGLDMVLILFSNNLLAVLD
jgi:hypothetical protein